jgi:ABC-type polar amino acid transport system ATPase subunit
MLLYVQEVTKKYGSDTILNSVSLKIKEGERVVMIGPSGSGKSTLLRCMAGLEKTDSGKVWYKGHDLEEIVKYDRTEIGLIFQSFDLFEHLTALENIMLAPTLVKGTSKEDSKEKALALLDKMHLKERANHYPEQLSGGQQQRIAIARALAMNPKLMFFDEPTSALDPEMTAEVLDVIVDLVQDGMTVVVVTHEMEFARRVGDRIIFMDQGEIIEDLPSAELASATKNPRIKQFLSKITQY